MLSPQVRALHEANRVSWNAATIAHNSHKGDQIQFFQDGGDTLFEEELALLGEIRQRRILHLQCNCGQDSLSLAKRGAQVTGVDISDQAIDFARHLARRTNIPVEFHRADLYDWMAEFVRTGEAFDIVFSSYGFLPYLSSLTLWAELMSKVLVPGGTVVLMDFHPVLRMFDPRGRLQHPYSAAGRPFTCERGVQDYVGESGNGLAVGEFQPGIRNFANPYPHHTFRWGLGELADALLAQELTIEVLREYPHANGQRYFHDSAVSHDGRILPPSSLPDLPMMFGLRARS